MEAVKGNFIPREEQAAINEDSLGDLDNVDGIFNNQLSSEVKARANYILDAARKCSDRARDKAARAHVVRDILLLAVDTLPTGTGTFQVLDV